jgi:hypothetical protein
VEFENEGNLKSHKLLYKSSVGTHHFISFGERNEIDDIILFFNSTKMIGYQETLRSGTPMKSM